MTLRRLLSLMLAGSSLAFTHRAEAQAVLVTTRLDTNTIIVGGTTTLRVFAQVAPAIGTNADRIFSWYLDVLNTNTAAVAGYDSMAKPASDNDPFRSSTGFNDGASRLGIYDTFLNLAGAGVASPVELMSIPVTGVSTGWTRFIARAGTGVTALSSDFIVAPLGGGPFWSGGDYVSAAANLRVIHPPTNVVKLLAISVTRPGGNTNEATLTYGAEFGYDCHVEYRDALGMGMWATFPGGPHNSGLYRDTNTVPVRFYRICATPAVP